MSIEKQLAIAIANTKKFEDAQAAASLVHQKYDKLLSPYVNRPFPRSEEERRRCESEAAAKVALPPLTKKEWDESQALEKEYKEAVAQAYRNHGFDYPPFSGDKPPYSLADLPGYLQFVRFLLRGKEDRPIEETPIALEVRKHFLECLERFCPNEWPAWYDHFQPQKFQTVRDLVAMMAWVGQGIGAEPRQPLPVSPKVEGFAAGGSVVEQCEQPAEYLCSWRDILACLKLKNNKETRGQISRWNKEHNGPIIIRKGGQPKVEKSKLTKWWNRLEILWQDQANQEAGKKMSAEAQHDYGASGTAAPEVGGGVKKRRRDRKP
jgi:hypothetical protein